MHKNNKILARRLLHEFVASNGKSVCIYSHPVTIRGKYGFGSEPYVTVAVSDVIEGWWTVWTDTTDNCHNWLLEKYGIDVVIKPNKPKCELRGISDIVTFKTKKEAEDFLRHIHARMCALEESGHVFWNKGYCAYWSIQKAGKAFAVAYIACLPEKFLRCDWLYWDNKHEMAMNKLWEGSKLAA